MVRALIGPAVLALLVGCALFPPAQDADVAQVRAQPFAAATVDAAIRVLARNGVATYDQPDATEPIVAPAAPPSPLALLRDQVRAMALEANAGGGIPGDEIDALVEVDDELAPPSYILAGYVADAETAGARLARELMGEQDWEQPPRLVYPQLVLVLFTADVVRETAAAATDSRDRLALGAGPGPRVVGRPMAMLEPVLPLVDDPADQVGAGACSMVQNFINNSLRRVFDALRLGESRGIGGFFAKVWNFVVASLETVVSRLIKAVTQKVLDLIAKVAAVVGTVSVIVSAIRPWTLAISPQPTVTEKGIAGGRQPEHGALVATVDLGGLDEWPAWAEDCARVAGQPLPNLKPEGTPVSWEALEQQPPALVSQDGAATQLDASGSARLDFTTLIDVVDDPYVTLPGMIRVSVTLERQSLRELADIAEMQLLGELPAIVRDAIYAPLLKPEIDRVIARLSSLISVSGMAPATVLYHVEQEATPSPATPTPDGTPRPTPLPTRPRDPGAERPRCESDCAMSNGDPHIVTVDGHGYDFQAAGEFVLLRSPDGNFELQVRQEPYPGTNNVTINTAVAMRIGGQRLTISAPAESGALIVLLDGQPVDLGQPIELAGGGRISSFGDFTGHALDIDFGDGNYVYVIGIGSYGLNVAVEPSDALRESGQGVMGTVAAGSLGVPALPDGTVLEATDDAREHYQRLYVQFADAWRVSDGATLFDYPAGASTETYTIRGYPREEHLIGLDDLTPAQRAAGEAACASIAEPVLYAQCVFDVGVTADPGFAAGYQQTYRLVDPTSLSGSGARLRLVNLYAEEGRPVDVDVYAYSYSGVSDRVAALVASVPYGQASAWFDPGLTERYGTRTTEFAVFRRGEQEDPLIPISAPTVEFEPGVWATITLSAGINLSDEPSPRWSSVYEANPREPQLSPAAPAGKALLLASGFGLPINGPVERLTVGAGDSCLFAPDAQDYHGPQPIGPNSAAYVVVEPGTHQLALHADGEPVVDDSGELAWSCAQPLTQPVQLDVRAGQRIHVFAFAPSPDEAIRTLVLPFER